MSFLEVLYFIVPSAIFYAAPLILVAIGGVFSERSGVINIGLEGLMVIGAFVGILFNLFFADTFGNATPWLSLIAAMVAALLLSLVHAVASISFRADQTVSGVAINLLAIALALYLVKKIFGKGQTDFITERFSRNDIPVLSDIPVIGPMFFSSVYYTSVLAIAVAIFAWFVIYKTPFGLRLRSVGEHPMAADTMGINVARMRYVAVMISGALAGIGGAIYAQTISGDFGHATINGQGFMALAAMIFGKWHPLGAMGAALFFGFAQSLSIVGPSIPYIQDIPNVFLLILPYVLTILALAGFIGRANAPKANGIPYIKGQR
ncbi:sugar ABC transporter permease [Planococcus glaciei]|uniref:ABC transporter permease n=1 Tax=Planococcus glaciei TaxID=459472 RepID=UPI0003DF11AD|nr:ABC transporter permease [Planococcus glaciei]ETP68752.1 branched-chain amino acid ABC transporter permease [Planococcus glaciei CHR43]KOF10434.1 sugar ABC transporter permease [Planococcus glaciei]MBX0313785.1 ABC transporter permease [Planococcus glaciei]SDH21215.1 simple sugar transport system permease protein [Planococcus glaciei]